MKFSSLAALEIVKMTTSSATSDINFAKMTISFKCLVTLLQVPWNMFHSNQISFYLTNSTDKWMAVTQYSTHTPS